LDAVTRRAASIPRRRSLLLLGSAGLAALTRTPSAAAKKSNKCDNEKKQCRSKVQDFCAEQGTEEQECLDALLPCCTTCKVGQGVICVVNVFTKAAG
jgi:hypothetical protein